jgi:lysozyme
MTTSDDGRELIEGFEGLHLKTYICPAGRQTIGYGHTGSDVHSGLTITEEQADQLLDNDLHRFEIAVNNLVTVDISQNIFDALISFAFNLGAGNLQGSHLLMYVNQNNFDAAVKEFPRWDHANGVVVAGLLRRRNAEAAMFSGGDWRSIMNGN